MSDSLDGSTISGALQNREEMRRWMRNVNRNLLLHRNMLDAVPLSGIADDPSAQLTVLAPPPLVKFSVIGTDGQFQVTITLPQDISPSTVSLLQNKVIGDSNQLGISMVHQLQSATNTNFDAAANVQTYGPFSELTQTFQLPNQTLFWRIRSSFDGSNWNEWQLYGSVPTAASWLPATHYVAGATVVPTAANGHTYRCVVAGTSGAAQPAFPVASGATVVDGTATWQEIGLGTNCGPVAVSSGFARSTSIASNSPVNNSNNAKVDSIDAGSSATIRAYGPGGPGSSWTRYDGQGGQTVIPSQTFAGAAYSTKYTVDYDPTTNSYPAPFPNASQYTATLPDRYYFVGQVTTVASGGGGGSPGGGGDAGGGDGGGNTGRPLNQL